MKSRSLLVCLAAALAALGGCGDITNLEANLETVTDTLSVFALNGTPTAYPTALILANNLGAPQVVRADGATDFDVAFDVDAQGRAVVYPLKMVKSALGTARQVGLLKATQPFADVTRAPSSGYSYDSVAVALAPGETVVVQAQSSSCGLTLSPNLYGKLVVDSVQTDARRIYFRAVVDPNCGFRSFASGIPKD